MKLTGPNDDISINISKKLSNVGIEGPIYVNKLGENLDTQILKIRSSFINKKSSSFINKKSSFEDNFAYLIEIYLRTILVIYEFKTRIKDIYIFLEKSVLEESNTILKNAKQNALNKLSPLCEDTANGESAIDKLITKIFDLLREIKPNFSENQGNEFDIYDPQKTNRETFIKNLNESYKAYTEKYEEIVTTTQAIKAGYDKMFELSDTTLLTDKYNEIIGNIKLRKELAESINRFQVPTLGAENVDLQYKPRIFDLNIYIEKDIEIIKVVDEGYNDIRKGLAEIAEIDRIEKERIAQENQQSNAKLKLRREEERKKEDERVNMWYQETIKDVMIKYRNNYHKLELAVKNINKNMMTNDNSKYGKTQVKLKTMEDIIAKMAEKKYITENRRKQYNNFLKKPKTTMLNMFGKYYPGKSAAQIAKARDAEDSKQTVPKPKTDNFIPVIDDVTYDFSELPFSDAEFDANVEKSEFDKTKAQILGVKLGEEKNKVKEIEQKLETVSKEYERKMKECDEEKGKLRKSFTDVLQEEGDFKKEGEGKSIQLEFNSYIHGNDTGFEMSVDDIIDKLINKRKPSTDLQKYMAKNMDVIARNKNEASRRGGKKKKVGKKTRKKKNIKKTRK